MRLTSRQEMAEAGIFVLVINDIHFVIQYPAARKADDKHPLLRLSSNMDNELVLEGERDMIVFTDLERVVPAMTSRSTAVTGKYIRNQLSNLLLGNELSLELADPAVLPPQLNLDQNNTDLVVETRTYRNYSISLPSNTPGFNPGYGFECDFNYLSNPLLHSNCSLDDYLNTFQTSFKRPSDDQLAKIACRTNNDATNKKIYSTLSLFKIQSIFSDISVTVIKDYKTKKVPGIGKAVYINFCAGTYRWGSEWTQANGISNAYGLDYNNIIDHITNTPKFKLIANSIDLVILTNILYELTNHLKLNQSIWERQ